MSLLRQCAVRNFLLNFHTLNYISQVTCKRGVIKPSVSCLRYMFCGFGPDPDLPSWDYGCLSSCFQRHRCHQRQTRRSSQIYSYCIHLNSLKERNILDIITSCRSNEPTMASISWCLRTATYSIVVHAIPYTFNSFKKNQTACTGLFFITRT